MCCESGLMPKNKDLSVGQIMENSPAHSSELAPRSVIWLAHLSKMTGIDGSSPVARSFKIVTLLLCVEIRRGSYRFPPGPEMNWVVSTGRRNILAKSLCWRLEVQRFPGPLVELTRYFVQLGLGVRRKIKALGEILAQQAIGIFV